MIKINIELWPYGDEEHKSTIGEMAICNDGTGNHRVGNYKFEYFDEKTQFGEEHTGEVKGFKRLENNVFDLLRECLNSEEVPIRCKVCGRDDAMVSGVCHHTHVI